MIVYFSENKKKETKLRNLLDFCALSSSLCENFKKSKYLYTYMLYSFVTGHAPANFASKEILSEKHRLEIYFRVIVAAL